MEMMMFSPAYAFQTRLLRILLELARGQFHGG